MNYPFVDEWSQNDANSDYVLNMHALFPFHINVGAKINWVIHVIESIELYC